MTETAQSPPSAGAPGRTLFISALGVGQICSWGSLYYAFPLIAEQIERETGWARTSLYGAATVGLLFAALASFPIGRAIDRGHGRLIMTGGSVLAGLLMLAWSRVEDLIGLYAIVGLLGAVQAATLYEAAFAVVARRFGAGDARGAIIALTLWGGFASTVFIPLIQLLIDLWGWRGALTALGLVNLLPCACLYGWAIRPSSDKPQLHAAGATPASSRITTAMASPVFWTLALAFTAHAAAFTAFTFHLYPLLLERGFSTTAVVAAMALIGPAQVGGRIAVTMFASKASMRRIGSWVVLVYGAANGILTIVRGAAVPEMLTKQNYGAVSGAMNTPATVARALSPLAAAALWSVSSSYDPVLLAILAGTLVLAAGFWSAALLSKDKPA
jgi:MFS family permease